MAADTDATSATTTFRPVSPATGRGRDNRLDAVRGALLLAMALNHVVNPLRLFTDHPLGWVSAAEGFVFLAGLVGAQVFARRHAREPGSVGPAVRARVATLYRWHVGTLLAVVGWTLAWRALIGAAPGQMVPGPAPLLQTDPGGALLSGLLLLQQPPLLDILSMYCAFFAIVPLLVRACASGRKMLALILSGAVWGITQLVGSPTPIEHGWVNLGAFHWSAWQLVFVAGFVLGWPGARPTRAAAPATRAAPATTFRPRLVLALPALGLVGLLAAQRHHWIPLLWPEAELIAATNKNLLAPLRLANFALLAYLVAAAAVWWPRALACAPLARLGRQALPAFAGQVVVATMLGSWPALTASAAATWLNSIAVLGSLAATVALAERVAAMRGKTHSPALRPTAQARAWSRPASPSNSPSSSKSIA